MLPLQMSEARGGFHIRMQYDLTIQYNANTANADHFLVQFMRGISMGWGQALS